MHVEFHKQSFSSHSLTTPPPTQERCESRNCVMSSLPTKRTVPDSSRHIVRSKVRKRPRTNDLDSQIEKLASMLGFWLAPTNLSHDRFLTNAMLREEGWIPVSLFATFNKVSAIQASEDDILSALRRLRAPPLEFAKDGNGDAKVRVAGGLMELKRLIDGVREDEDERTIYVETLPADATREQVTEIFKRFGEIAYVSVPRFPGGDSKGFGFVEYNHIGAAEKALTAIRERRLEVPCFPTLRALPRAEWRRRKEKYKDGKRAVQVAATKAKLRDTSSPHAHLASDDGELQHSVHVSNPNIDKASVNDAVTQRVGDSGHRETRQPENATPQEANRESHPKQRQGANDSRKQQLQELPGEANEENNEDEIEAETESTLPFERGLIVFITGLEKAKKKKTRRGLFESLKEYGPVAYVDFSPRTPDICTVRFASVPSAHAAVTALAPSGGGTILGVVVTASILSGESETKYWASIHEHRVARKTRQASKVAAKAVAKAGRRVKPRTQPKRPGKGD